MSTINPFYAQRLATSTPANTDESKVEYARLPKAPKNASPVPHLTSLYQFHRAGEYGDRRYPGNCGGQLIRDLIQFFQATSVLDPMTGSGTCKDVCRELGVPCYSSDIRFGQDACSSSNYPMDAQFPLVWLHPPYWRMKVYTTDPRDLSQAPTLAAFLERYRRLIQNCAAALTPQGKLVILMGDYHDRTEGYMPLVYHTKQIAFSLGLKQNCTDIIRFSHGASSSKKVYRSSFIPGLHDVCMIFEHYRAISPQTLDG